MEMTKVLLERAALTASLSALRVNASHTDRRPVTELLLVATVDAVFRCKLALTDLELRLVNVGDEATVLVPSFHASLAVFIRHSIPGSIDALVTEWLLLFEAVWSQPSCWVREIATYLLER